MKRQWGVTVSLCILVAMLAGSLLPVASDPALAANGQTIVRVYYPDRDMGNKVLLAFEPQLLETNYDAGYHVMEVTQPEIDRLVALGLRVERDDSWRAPATVASVAADVESIPSYPCYRTVEETFASAQALVAAHPDLAAWSDVGDSWQKTVGQGGYDMLVLKLTNSVVPGPKPKLFLTAAIHAREYATAELVTRFAEYLVANYGIDPDATWILDHHEVHLMLQTNPDGRKKAETGLSWRKNTNNNYCANTNYRGADLNRNFAFEWACCGGSSSYVCDATYHGPAPASEPETQAVQAYLDLIFPDQRGPNLTDPAPGDATGVYIDVHSYGQLVLWPWGFTSSLAPNATALRTLGRKYAYFNSHTPQQSYALYATDGTTDDHAYGNLGVAAYCFEVGTAFFQSCSYFETTLLPANLPALIYAAKVVRTPYLTPAGPDALSLALSSGEVPAGTPVTLNASINDTRYNNTNGTEPTQAIAAAEYYLDLPPWGSGATAHAMAASDGSFNSTVEAATATVDTTGLSTGKHLLFVRGRDAAGNWGAISAIFLAISGAPSEPPVADPQSVTTAEDTSLGILLTGSDPEGAPLTYSVTSGPSHGTLSGTAPSLTYAPAANYNGPDSFAFAVSDGTQSSGPATVSIDVTPVNDAPVASSQSVTTQQEAAVAITLTGSDVDGDPLTYSVVTLPGHGLLSGAAPNLTYTPDAGYTGGDSFAFEASDGQLSSNVATVSITVNARGPRLYLGSSTSGTAGAIAFADEDILVKDMATGAWALYIDGSDVGLANTDVDAFELQADGSLLVSFDTAFTLSGFTAVDDSDILRFVPTSTGETTAGSWQWYFDGSDVGLSTSDEDVDAFALTLDGRLLISTLGNVSVTGASGADEDLLAFAPAQLGSTTSGTWSMYFDGSDVGLSSTSNEDVNGIWIDAAGKIYLTTIGSFGVTGVSGDGSDIVVCTPGSLGSTTTCTWAMYWDGSANGFAGEDTDSVGIVP